MHVRVTCGSCAASWDEGVRGVLRWRCAVVVWAWSCGASCGSAALLALALPLALDGAGSTGAGVSGAGALWARPVGGDVCAGVVAAAAAGGPAVAA